jgi:hypothetical protein
MSTWTQEDIDRTTKALVRDFERMAQNTTREYLGLVRAQLQGYTQVVDILLNEQEKLDQSVKKGKA